MVKLTGKGLADFAKTKIGTPYVYGAKGAHGAFTQTKLDTLSKMYPKVFTASYIAKAKKLVGKVCCDCSGLVSWYTEKEIGSSQMYATANQRVVLNKSNTSKVPVGAVLWREGHVGAYIGGGCLIEAKGIDYGCVKSNVVNTAFTHYLLFDYMKYDMASCEESHPEETVFTRGANPYREPTGTLKIGDRNESVKWLQFELREAGYFEVEVNGIYDGFVEEYVKQFQQSCKIMADGAVGRITRDNLMVKY